MRERYIRVAEIDIAISEGIKNIYVVERHEDSRLVSSTTCLRWDVPNQAPLTFAEESAFFVLKLEKLIVPFRSKQMKT
jgi:hypothetical protein